MNDYIIITIIFIIIIFVIIIFIIVDVSVNRFLLGDSKGNLA